MMALVYLGGTHVDMCSHDTLCACACVRVCVCVYVCVYVCVCVLCSDMMAWFSKSSSPSASNCSMALAISSTWW
jgi:hypothetical protein